MVKFVKRKVYSLYFARTGEGRLEPRLHVVPISLVFVFLLPEEQLRVGVFRALLLDQVVGERRDLNQNARIEIHTRALTYAHLFLTNLLDADQGDIVLHILRVTFLLELVVDLARAEHQLLGIARIVRVGDDSLKFGLLRHVVETAPRRRQT